MYSKKTSLLIGFHGCDNCGNRCGHIGIYVGGGYIVHSYGESIHKDASKTKVYQKLFKL
ncbi:MAG: hypothetical protein IKQ71_06095 [Lachnospiraceae bacterium]|nr:hypothetical protein [Lachnospiraceae bacterium]